MSDKRLRLPKWAVSLFAGIFVAGVMSGCVVKDGNGNHNDDTAPTAPRGVFSVSGDGQVTVRWIPNGERDLAGYDIYRSQEAGSNFRKIATVSSRTDEYVDRDVQNGRTYFYAVLAFDDDGNESDLSPENVEDTPRPEGFGLTLFNYRQNPARSALIFSQAARGATHWDLNGDDLLDNGVDVFFGYDEEVDIAYLYSDHDDVFMQDLGYHEMMDEVDTAPIKGYTTISVEMIEGHVYAIYTPDGHYAKIRVLQVSRNSVTFDWAYQLQPDNSDLAPSLRLGKVTRGRPRSR